MDRKYRWLMFFICMLGTQHTEAKLPIKKYVIQNLDEIDLPIYYNRFEGVSEVFRISIWDYIGATNRLDDWDFLNKVEIIRTYTWKNLLLTNMLTYQYYDIFSKEQSKKTNLFWPRKRPFYYGNKKQATKHYFNLFSILPQENTQYPIQIAKDTTLYLKDGMQGSYYNYILHYCNVKKWENNPDKLEEKGWASILNTKEKKVRSQYFNYCYSPKERDSILFEVYQLSVPQKKGVQINYRSKNVHSSNTYFCRSYDKTFLTLENIKKYDLDREKVSEKYPLDVVIVEIDSLKGDTIYTTNRDDSFVKEEDSLWNLFSEDKYQPFAGYSVKVVFIEGLRDYLRGDFDYIHPSDLILIFDKNFYNFDFNVSQLYYSMEPFLSFEKPESYIPFFVLLTDTYFGTDGSTFTYTGQKKNRLYFTFFSQKLQKEIALTFKKTKNPVLTFKEK